MGLEQVNNEIVARANAEADALISDAKARGRKYHETAEKALKQFKENVHKELEQELMILEKKRDAHIHLEQKKVIMEMKKKVLKEVYGRALDTIEKWPEKQQKQFFEAALKNAKTQMDIGTVYCNQDDKKVLSSVLSSLGRDAEQSKAQKAITLETKEMQGIIVENKDKTQRLNFTYTSLMERTREITLQEIGKRLF